MKNADMPAMPLAEPEIWVDSFDPSKGTTEAYGLTKREYFMAHRNIDGDTMTFQTTGALEEFIGRKVNIDSVEDIVFAQAEAMAKIKRIQVDADIAELEKTNG